ncbi:MAG: hypothetical protein GX041_01120 [Clostridiales bacterium]|nr:hypothetical protein [Clostridiales bacterium]
MFLKKYKVNIKVITPFNIASGEDIGGVADKSVVLFNGQPYIPGSTIKGKMRRNFRKIADINHTGGNCKCPLCSIFGAEGYKPSRIYVDNFLPITDHGDVGTIIRFGNAIDRYKHTAKDNALFATEVVKPSVFTGQITVYFDKNTIGYKEEIELSIKMIDSVGGDRSRGLGRVKVELEEVTQ